MIKPMYLNETNNPLIFFNLKYQKKKIIKKTLLFWDDTFFSESSGFHKNDKILLTTSSFVPFLFTSKIVHIFFNTGNVNLQKEIMYLAKHK